jgi:hypothetical protein
MTVMRELAKLYNSNFRNKDAIMIYEEARAHYMSLPQVLKEGGDVDSPFDWLMSAIPILH